ncbi:MAG: hypothetical protein HFF89_07595 [Oscillibacter sp.]|jgi:hypothetical protein|nr:hypothetical protein [Oscillibacter sp.]MCI8690689.1 hypothetical protein [Oscillibacter sp.]MCI9375185.1 hypothetical protein [Oscillibacter sp.]MCI9480798.1 hypothetical protein [Oscillibacter sp.]
MSDLMCPYCLSYLKKADLIRVCTQCGKDQKKDQKKALLFSFGDVLKCTATKNCRGRFANLRCGLCGERLPPNITQYRKYTRLVVVAPSGGGKTVFITTMLEEVQKNARLLGLNFSPMDNSTAIYQDENAKLLYNNRRMPDGTNAGVIQPLQWSVQNIRQSSGNLVPTYSLTLFDGAGEDQAQADDIICRYIAEAKMILLLLDPTKLYGVRKMMTNEEIERAGGRMDETVTRNTTKLFIDGIISYIKNTNNIHVGRKMRIPVAVAFAKMDMMRRFFPEDAVVFQPSGHVRGGRFNKAEAEAVHWEIDNWMAHCGDDLSQTFHANFQNWRYFGLSSFGVPPSSRKALAQEPQPLRVLDPLLWNFELEGINP